MTIALVALGVVALCAAGWIWQVWRARTCYLRMSEDWRRTHP